MDKYYEKKNLIEISEITFKNKINKKLKDEEENLKVK
jgi:hypothetical protein